MKRFIFDNFVDGDSLGEFRYERKFLVQNIELLRIEHLIKNCRNSFSEIFYQRKINNIYLDSFSKESYLSNIFGTFHRVKIRIRWYGETFRKIEEPVLELKLKKGELGKKMSFTLKPFTLDKTFSKKKLDLIFKNSSLPNWLREMLKFYNPVLLNSYNRKYFISKNKNYRMTLDFNMKFYHLKENNNFFVDNFFDNLNTVVELKYLSKNDEFVDQITQSFPFRLTKNSKYISGIDSFIF